jgi:putative sterol carrier protein
MTEEFFSEISRHGSERLAAKTNGTIRFDLTDDHGVAHWLIAIDRGNIEVRRDERDADVVLRTTTAIFDRMVQGEVKPLSAWLRNDITSEGEFRFIILLERLFATPRGARHPRTVPRVPARSR